MKVSLPSHVPMKWVFPFVLALMAVQAVEGTPFILAFTSGAFMVLSALAFNVAGGLQYPSGAYIFFLAVESAILGILAKAVLGEPLQTNVANVQFTLAVYCAGTVSILAAAMINQRLRRRRPLLQNKVQTIRASQVGLGCLLIGFGAVYLTPESLEGTAHQFNRFAIFAILYMVAARVKETDGSRSFTWLAFIGWSVQTVLGILAFSKEGMFAPSVAWGIGAVAGGYRLSLRKALVVALTAVPAVALLTPISQLGRYRVDDGKAWDVAVDMLSHPLQIREEYQQIEVEHYLEGVEYHWFDRPLGIVDRLTFVPIDDALIYVTDHGQPGDSRALASYFINAIPRYLYPDKPSAYWGNIYAHQIGLLADDDDSTAIAFTPFADAYHTLRWFGVCVVSCGMFLGMFFVCDSVSGTVADGPWALLYILWFAHSAAEGALSQPVYSATTFTLVVIAVQLVTTYVAPVLGAFALMPRRSTFETPLTQLGR